MNRRSLLSSAAVALFLALMPASAVSAEDLAVSTGGHVFGAPGTVLVLTTQAVPAELVGQTCSASYVASNNSSVHPGNDLIVSSDGGTAVLTGVEDAPDRVINSSGEVVLGAAVVVSLRFGTDGEASLDVDVTLRCAPRETTSTNTTTTSTTSTTTTISTAATTTGLVTITTAATVGTTTTATTTTLLAVSPGAVTSTTANQAAVAGPAPSGPSAGGDPPAALPQTGTSNIAVVITAATLCLALGAILGVSRRRAAHDAVR